MINIDDLVAKFNQYFKGKDGAKINYDEAYKIALQIAEHRELLGNHVLGLCNQYGVGIEQNIPEAIRLFSINVDRGNSVSMVQLGLLYQNSKLINPDYEKAEELFIRAAKLNDVDSMRHLGKLYSNVFNKEQRNVQIDLKKAVYYYKLAADRGDIISAEKYGDMLMNGLGVPKNIDEALHYYNMAGSSQKVKTKIDMLNHIGNENELMQIVNERYVSTNPLRRLKKNTDEINWEWGDIICFQ